ncbi:hypothetical protein B0D95_06210 [Cellvibrio sp. PSBB023]|nr:hypothetical protein B0D95_06210 [Cellvibrio sp. PSBB023]
MITIFQTIFQLIKNSLIEKYAINKKERIQRLKLISCQLCVNPEEAFIFLVLTRAAQVVAVS